MPSVTKVSQMINANDENRVTLQSELDEDFATANDAIGSLIRKEQTGFMKQIERRRQEVRYSLWVAHIRQTLSMNCCKKNHIIHWQSHYWANIDHCHHILCHIGSSAHQSINHSLMLSTQKRRKKNDIKLPKTCKKGKEKIA